MTKDKKHPFLTNLGALENITRLCREDDIFPDSVTDCPPPPHPARIGQADSPAARICRVLEWYVPALGAGCPRAGKPYNPVLGEVFACSWPAAEGRAQLRYLAEQVCHHPPGEDRVTGAPGWQGGKGTGRGGRLWRGRAGLTGRQGTESEKSAREDVSWLGSCVSGRFVNSRIAMLKGTC